MMGSATASADLREAQREAREARSDVGFIKHDIERLLMITEALWMLLKKEHGYDDAVLNKMIAEIDLRDGKLDGRVTSDAPQHCRFCGRVLSKKRAFCIFCGKPSEIEPFAR